MHTNINKGSFRPTNMGFLTFNTGTITVDGVTLVGYGILVRPNFNGYYILQITGTDALSMTWATAGGKGTVWGAIGPDNDLFMKWNNTQTTLFISGTSLNNLIPFPPASAGRKFLAELGPVRL